MKEHKRVSFDENSNTFIQYKMEEPLSPKKPLKKPRKLNESRKKNVKEICINILLPLFLVFFVCLTGYFLLSNKSTGIKLIRVKDYDELSNVAGKIIADIIKANPRANLGLPTGSSPLGLFKYLIQKNKNKEISFENVKTFNLDEYCDLPISHPESFHSFMNNNLFNHIDINQYNIHVPNGLGNLEKNCYDYNKILKQNQIDIQLLGIGSNGHIGYNEPFTSFKSETHIVELAQSTREDNKRFFGGNINEVPTKAITVGIANILTAKKILLIASGKNKAKAIKMLVEGDIDTKVPATSLRTFPGPVYVVADEEACELLSKK